jgi:hypothetical protein
MAVIQRMATSLMAAPVIGPPISGLTARTRTGRGQRRAYRFARDLAQNADQRDEPMRADKVDDLGERVIQPDQLRNWLRHIRF